MAESDLSDLKGDVRVLKSVVENGQKETSRRLDKIENKIDAQANVSVGVFEAFKNEVKEDFVTKDQFTPVKDKVLFIEKILYSFIGLIVVAVLGAIVRGVLTQ